MLTQAQGTAYLVQLRAFLNRSLAHAIAVQTNSESGVLHKAAVFMGLGSDNSVDAVPGDLRMELSQCDSLERALPDAVADASKAASWLELANTLQTNAGSDLSDEEHATLDGILSDTAEATTTRVKEIVTIATGGLLAFVPSWAWWAGGGAAVLLLAWRFLPKEKRL